MRIQKKSLPFGRPTFVLAVRNYTGSVPTAQGSLTRSRTSNRLIMVMRVGTAIVSISKKIILVSLVCYNNML
jgi:hypothetical protein